MKKKLIKLMALLLVVAMSLSTFACQLIQVDMERVYDQTVATVQVFDEDGARVDKITNKEVMTAYASNGAYYIYNMGYTVEEALDAILDNIVNNKIIVQEALNYFNEKGLVEDNSISDKWEVKRYLTVDEIATAEYNVKKGVNDAIESYLPNDEDEDVKESYSPTARTVPTGATNYEKELTVEYKRDIYDIDTGIANGNGTVNDKTRRNAYYKLLKSMSESGYIESSFDWNTDSILDTDYYKESLQEQLENTLATKYQAYLVYDYYTSVTLAQLNQVYVDSYNAQAEGKTYTEFNTALSQASASAPVLYNQYSGKFAYVYNLLLGIDDIQSAKLAELDKSNTNQYRLDREDLFKSTTTVKDLRASWIDAGYDFSKVTDGKIYFDNDYALASGDDRFAFQGTYTWVNGEGYEKVATLQDGKYYYEYKKGTEVDEDYVPEYKAVANELTLDAFIEEMEKYLYGAVQTGVSGDIIPGVPTYKAVKSTAALSDDKINELLFAFSTDPGSLNTYKGYVVAEDYDLAYTEQYMEEFAKAGRKLIEWAKEDAIGSYIIVATDYGYHVMFMNELVLDTDNKANLYAYLGMTEQELETKYADMLKDIRDGEVDEYEDNYLYHLQQSVASSSASTYANNIVLGKQNSARANSDKVSINRDYLKNLL